MHELRTRSLDLHQVGLHEAAENMRCNLLACRKCEAAAVASFLERHEQSTLEKAKARKLSRKVGAEVDVDR